MSPIRPFKIAVPENALQKLRHKLDLTNLPERMEEDNGEDGARLSDVERLIEKWKTFDWRAQEAKLNEFPHFKTEIEVERFGDVEVHFLHVRSKVEGAVPLLFVHGWPGSFYEGTKIIPLLTDPENGPAFHVVVPSLPNFGFSQRITKRDFDIKQYAETMHKVMLLLGYDQYVTQGGDWGYFITRTIAHLYPASARAMHTNFPLSAFPSAFSPILFLRSVLKFASILPVVGPILKFVPFLTYSPAELTALERAKSWAEGPGRAYWILFGTKPQTIAYSFADSPAGLLGFLWEKMKDWSQYDWSDEEILTWVSIYWFSTPGADASVWIYKEGIKGMGAGEQLTSAQFFTRSEGKIGVSCWPGEILRMPRLWLQGLGDVVFWREHERGGHFAAFENPEELVGDLREMFGKTGGAFGVVEGKDGY